MEEQSPLFILSSSVFLTEEVELQRTVVAHHGRVGIAGIHQRSSGNKMLILFDLIDCIRIQSLEADVKRSRVRLRIGDDQVHEAL